MSQLGIAQGDLVGLTNAMRALFPIQDFFQTFGLIGYPFLNRTMGRRKNIGGADINWSVRYDASGQWKWTRPWGTDTHRAEDKLVNGRVRHCFGDTHWMIDDREDDLNSGEAKVVDLMESRRAASFEDAAENIEYAGFSLPNDSSDDLRPYGIPYWLPFGSTGSYTEGFVGERARFLNWPGGSSTTATTTTIGNIDRSAYPRLKSWAGTHNGKCDQTFVRKLRKARMDTKMNPPVIVKDGVMQRGNDHVIYVPQSFMLQILDELDRKNQNFQRDISSGDSRPLMDGVPFEHAPALDPRTDGESHAVRSYQPIYGVNHRQWDIWCLRGRWMKERPTRPHERSHNIAVTYVDCAMQIVAPNPRYCGFCLHLPISA